MPTNKKTIIHRAHDQEDLPKVWRSAMAYTYMVICICDFIVFPILWSAAQAAFNGGRVETEWHPLTLEGGGLLHIAFGAILGVSAMKDNIYQVVERVRRGHVGTSMIIEREVDDVEEDR